MVSASNTVLLTNGVLLQDGIFETGKQMAEGIESTAEKASDIVQDVGDTIQDNLVLTKLTSKKDAADQKYADSLTSISKEQEIQLEDQVSSPLC